MASSSATSLTKISYDVFLSFRGSDTRPNLTCHLYDAFVRKHIHTFLDENDLARGEEISPTLLRIIEESKISVIIFSENYASSPWCLDELVKIMECKRLGQTAVPIFYKVDPSDVSDLTGKFGEAFKKEKEQSSKCKDRIQKWCSALKEAADISGWDSSNYRNEVEFIGKIVEDIVHRLYPNPFTTSKGLVGMDSHIERILPCLSMGSRDVRFVGLWGMGGIGKTTIAEILYGQISYQFDRYYFFHSVREESEKNGLICLKRKFLSQLLGIESTTIEMLYATPTYIKDSLNRIKVVVVLDDVSNPEQLEALCIGEGWFGPGSRIILTSRDKEVFNNVGEIYIYKVEGLDKGNALELLSMKAFKRKDPPEDYMELLIRVLRYAQGLPLALKVLGSHLCERTPQEWEMELDKLNQFPDPSIMKILELSFEELDDDLKLIFLDICCLKGYTKDSVINFLGGRGSLTRRGLNRLTEKCLITSHDEWDRLEMHDLVQEMGQEIARRKGRLYNNKDIIHISTINTRNETVEAIVLNIVEVPNLSLMQAMLALPGSRLTHLWDGNQTNETVEFIVLNTSEVEEVHFSCEALSLMPKLRLVIIRGYPFKSLPFQCLMQSLVVLELPWSKLTHLWDGNQCRLPNLKILNLEHSYHLKRLPDLSSATKLEDIYLDGCGSLEVLPPCIGTFKNLTTLSVNYCENLRSIPSLVHANSLRAFEPIGCSNLKLLPELPSSIKYLGCPSCGVEEWPVSLDFLNSPPCIQSFKTINLDENPIRELPSSIRCLSSSLICLSMCSCKHLEILSDSMCELKCLQSLCLTGCSKLSKLPPLNGLTSLVELHLDNSGIVEIPTDIVSLPSLNFLSVDKCKRLRSLPLLPWQLEKLEAGGCRMLQVASIASNSLIYLSNPTDFPAITGDYEFNFSNCVKLDNNARHKIMADACWRVEEMTILPRNGKTRFKMLIPGTEIPEWFKYQSEGNSVVVKFPHFSYPSYLTLAFCIAVEFPRHCDFWLDFDSHWEPIYDFVRVFIKYQQYVYGKDRFYDRGHVFLWYSNYQSGIIDEVFSGKEKSFQFKLEGGFGPRVRVKRCGVQWVVLKHK